MSLIEKAAEKLKAKEASLLERAAGRLADADALGAGGRPVSSPADSIEKSIEAQQAAVERATLEKAVAATETVVSAPAPGAAAGPTASLMPTQVRPAVSSAPSAAQPGVRSGRHAELDLERLKERGFITPDTDPTLAAEEFRIIKRSLLLKAFAKGDAAIERGNLILVSSCQPSEGKTFSAINLALSMATEQDLTVLLVDADFAKPDVLKTLGVESGKGLVDVISDRNVGIGDCLIRTNIPNLTLLPAGRRHNLTTELLASERMADIVRELAERYPDRVIIFDSPPVLASSASSVMGLHVGQILFVVEAERTAGEQIEEALSMLSSCDNISMVLNKSRFVGGAAKFGSYYGYGYGYGYGNRNQPTK